MVKRRDVSFGIPDTARTDLIDNDRGAATLKERLPVTVYLIADIKIHDWETYREYEAGFPEVIAPYGGKIHAVADNPRVIEGDWNSARIVVLSFPDEAAFDDWYGAEATQKLIEKRTAASTANLLLATGRD